MSQASSSEDSAAAEDTRAIHTNHAEYTSLKYIYIRSYLRQNIHSFCHST